jgi:dimethylhistidine N-methyltransferase
MNTRIRAPLPRAEVERSRAAMSAQVRAGLRGTPKRAASKWFYDARGSELFERICEQPEYYLTRVELEILERDVARMAESIGERALVVEYGSGSGIKTRLLLEALRDPVAYVPVELSEAALAGCVESLGGALPSLEIFPLCADFCARLDLPRPARAARRVVVFFPGSTIGNFDRSDAVALLERTRALVGSGGCALVGADLDKDRATLEAAYNDAAGVTAEFTLNMLARFNRELGADFDLRAFAHRARYNALAGRIETDVVSAKSQVVTIDGERFAFEAGEALRVEISAKYTLAGFARLARRAGFSVEQVWTDAGRRFSVQMLV